MTTYDTKRRANHPSSSGARIGPTFVSPTQRTPAPPAPYQPSRGVPVVAASQTVHRTFSPSSGTRALPPPTRVASTIAPPVQEDPRDIPVVIIVRDRVSALQRLVHRLEWAGQRRIILLDNSSTYPPLLTYLAQSPHQVVRTGRNDGPVSPWSSSVLANHGGHFIVTDPDMVPEDACPNDFVAVLLETIQRAPPHVKKVGLSLRIDDLPRNPVADHVRAHESRFWRKTIGVGTRGELWYDAEVDTTFAIYAPRRGYDGGGTPAIRLGPPYTMHCDSWYMDPAALSEEERYYCEHASASSTWVKLVTAANEKANEKAKGM